LNSTYVEGLLKLVDQETRRIHTSFRQTGSATGRLSSVEPNLQNIPIRTELGREIRRAFVAPSDDWVLLSADYSQIELRVLAHITGDSRLQRAFHNDEDIHTRTAADIYGCSAENVTAEMRRTAKVINFGIAYGMSAYGLAENLSIPPEEAQVIIDSYFQTYPGVRRYTEEIVAEARRLGYVTTLLKRRRPIPDIRSPNRQAREFAERAAINSPIQGSAADIIKVAMVKLHHQLLAHGFRSRMVLQVHDELVFEVPRDEITAVAPVIRKEMESAYPLVVPLKVDLEIGNNWRDMEPLGRDEGYWSPRSELCCEQLKGTLRK
jgi:DNA polymerase-1